MNEEKLTRGKNIENIVKKISILSAGEKRFLMRKLINESLTIEMYVKQLNEKVEI